MVEQASEPSTRKAKARRTQAWGQPRLHSKTLYCQMVLKTTVSLLTNSLLDSIIFVNSVEFSTSYPRKLSTCYKCLLAVSYIHLEDSGAPPAYLCSRLIIWMSGRKEWTERRAESSSDTLQMVNFILFLYTCFISINLILNAKDSLRFPSLPFPPLPTPTPTPDSSSYALGLIAAPSLRTIDWFSSLLMCSL